MTGKKWNSTTLLLNAVNHNKTHMLVRINLKQILHHRGKSLTVIHFTVEVNQCDPPLRVKLGCADDSSVMDDALEHDSKRPPVEEVKVILPLT